MWLIERLPKDDNVCSSKQKQGTELIELDIARKIREQLKKSRLMEFQLIDEQFRTFLPSELEKLDVNDVGDSQKGIPFV